MRKMLDLKFIDHFLAPKIVNYKKLIEDYSMHLTLMRQFLKMYCDNYQSIGEQGQFQPLFQLFLTQLLKDLKYKTSRPPLEAISAINNSEFKLSVKVNEKLSFSGYTDLVVEGCSYEPPPIFELKPFGPLSNNSNSSAAKDQLIIETLGISNKYPGNTFNISFLTDLFVLIPCFRVLANQKDEYTLVKSVITPNDYIKVLLLSAIDWETEDVETFMNSLLTCDDDDDDDDDEEEEEEEVVEVVERSWRKRKLFIDDLDQKNLKKKDDHEDDEDMNTRKKGSSTYYLRSSNHANHSGSRGTTRSLSISKSNKKANGNTKGRGRNRDMENKENLVIIDFKEDERKEEYLDNIRRLKNWEAKLFGYLPLTAENLSILNLSNGKAQENQFNF